MRRVLFWILLLKGAAAMAQVDPHFSQFYAYPLWLNPGMAGAMDGDYRITGIYRKQWSGIAPYTTAGMSAGVKTNRNISLGINFLNQSAGDAGYNYLNAYGTVAYDGIKFGIDNAQQVSIGIQAGILSRKFDPGKFRFGDQWNPTTGYDPAAPVTDFVSFTSAAVFDAGAGIYYQDGSEGKQVNLFGGISAFHLTQPEDPFIMEGEKGKLPVRYAVHGGARIRATDNFSLVPNLLYVQQGNATEKFLGLYGELNANHVTNLLFGMYYRLGDGFSPYAGVSYQQMTLGVSYDITTSGLGEMVNNANSIELSFTFTGRGKGRSLESLGCPRF